MELANKILSDITVYMKYARYLEDENRPLVTRSSVKKLFKTIPLSRPIQELNRQLEVAPKYLPRTEEVPFINKAANWLDDGMVCRGSRSRFAFLLTPPEELRLLGCFPSPRIW